MKRWASRHKSYDEWLHRRRVLAIWIVIASGALIGFAVGFLLGVRR